MNLKNKKKRSKTLINNLWKISAALSISNHRDKYLVLLFSTTIYILYSLSFPISAGRDFGTYVYYFFDIWVSKPTFFMLMAYRTPATPIFYSLLTIIGGSILVEIVLGILYVAGNLVMFNILKKWGSIWGWLYLAIITCHLHYQILIHKAGSDNLFSLLFVLWLGYLFNIYSNINLRKILIFALFTFILVMVRPSAQLLILVGIFPIITKAAVKDKIRYVGLFLVTYFIFIGLFSTYHLIRYKDFTLSRGAKAFLPMYRLFTVDKLIRPENGPYSQKLSQTVNADLLQKEPYRTYNIDENMFFSFGDPRMMNDLVGLSDRNYGWDSNYEILANASTEAIKKYPFAYLLGVTKTLQTIFEIPGNINIEVSKPSQIYYIKTRSDLYQSFAIKGIPIPTEDSIIPGSNTNWLSSNPNNEIPSKENVETIDIKATQIIKEYPSRSESSPIKNSILNLQRIFRHLKIYLFILLGLIGLVIANKIKDRILLLTVLSSMLIILATYAGFDLVMEYRYALDPIFILSGLAGLSNIINRVLNAKS